MPSSASRWTQRDVDWVAARLLPDIYDINKRDKYNRVTRRLNALYQELMKIRLTEDVFFWGKEHKAGDIMDVPDGPYKNTLVGGKGLVRVPQFVEIPSVTDTPPVPTTPPATFAEATASVIKPQPAPAKQAKSHASVLSQLAARRNKLHDQIGKDIDAYTKRLTDMETNAPTVFAKANTVLDDEQSGLTDLENSLQEFAGSNGVPLP